MNVLVGVAKSFAPFWLVENRKPSLTPAKQLVSRAMGLRLMATSSRRFAAKAGMKSGWPRSKSALEIGCVPTDSNIQSQSSRWNPASDFQPPWILSNGISERRRLVGIRQGYCDNAVAFSLASISCGARFLVFSRISAGVITIEISTGLAARGNRSSIQSGVQHCSRLGPNGYFIT